jgi:hypothetical protein
MLLRSTNGLLGILMGALATTGVFSADPGQTALRKMKHGDTMPEFSLPGSTGKVFEYKQYKHNRKRVLAMVFSGFAAGLCSFTDLCSLAFLTYRSAPVVARPIIVSTCAISSRS